MLHEIATFAAEYKSATKNICAMLIDIKNASITLGDNQEILKDINLTVDEGEFVYIIGPVGSGKTSLLRVIDAELKAKGELISVLDRDLLKIKRKNISALRREMGVVFQDFKLLRDRTVDDNLHFALRATGWKNKEERQTRIAEVMTEVGLHDKLAKFPHELSGGEQQRVAIARAILNHPKLVLADEPTGNLDPENAEKIMRILHTIKDKGAAVVMVTHNQHLIDAHPATTYICSEMRFDKVK